MEALLQAVEAWILWVAQQTCVVELHQDVHAGKITACVEPGNIVEVQRTRCARDDDALKRDVRSLGSRLRLLF